MTADGSTGGSGATDPELYASVVEAMADGVVRFDPDGTIAFVNGAVESFLGTDRETLVGGTLERLVEGDRFDRSAYERVAAAFGAIRDGDEDERRVTIETERAEALELRLCGIRANGAIRGIVGTIRDVTRRERALETLERQQRAIYRLHQMDADGGRSVDGKLRRALDIGCEFLDLPIGFVASVDGETHRIDHVVGTDDVAVGTSRPLNSTYCRRTVEGDGPVAIRDAETEFGADDPAYAETGISCYIGTEIRVGGELHGTFCFAAPDARDRSFSDDERAFVRLLGLWAGYNRERERFETTLRGLHDVSREMILAETEREVAELAVGAAEELFDLPITACWRYDGATDTLEPLAETEAARELVGGTPVLERGETLVWGSVGSGDVLTFEDLDAEAGTYGPGTPLRSEIHLPLGSRGVIVSGATEPRSFEGIDTESLRLLGDLTRDAFVDIAQREAITERGEALQRQNDRLDEFARVVAHDLRNPLAGAVGFLEIARETHDERHFDRVRGSHSRMQQLIEELLDIARGSRNDVDPRELPLDGIVEEAWSYVDAPGATLAVPDDLGRIHADETRLLQLFGNLFRNCVEHAGETVTVTVGLLERGAGFYVADDGPGLSKGAREDVLTLGKTASATGTGIGLASVTDIVDAHGWELSIPETDGGARFEIGTGDGSLMSRVTEDGNDEDNVR